MKQVIWASREGGTSGTNFMCPLQMGAGNWEITERPVPVLAAGTIRYLRIQLATYTIRKNGVDTALVVTITSGNTFGENLVDAVSFSAGDTISLKRVQTLGTRSYTRVTLEFEGDTIGASIYGANFTTIFNNTAVRLMGLFQAHVTPLTATEVLAINTVMCPGTLNEASYVLSVAPGSGISREFVIVKNGVDQDGAGGTVDTKVTIADTATSGSKSFSLPLAQGDTVHVKTTPIGTTASANGMQGFRFTATEDHTWNVCGGDNGFSTSATEYAELPGLNRGQSTTEADRNVNAGPTTFRLRKLYARMNATLASGSYQLTVRKNSATPTGTLTVVLDSANQERSDLVNATEYVDGDVFALQSAPSSPSASRNIRWSLMGDSAPAAPPGGAARALVNASLADRGLVGGGLVS
jgi:hypothetical protein